MDIKEKLLKVWNDVFILVISPDVREKHALVQNAKFFMTSLISDIVIATCIICIFISPGKLYFLYNQNLWFKAAFHYFFDSK